MSHWPICWKHQTLFMWKHKCSSCETLLSVLFTSNSIILFVLRHFTDLMNVSFFKHIYIFAFTPADQFVPTPTRLLRDHSVSLQLLVKTARSQISTIAYWLVLVYTVERTWNERNCSNDKGIRFTIFSITSRKFQSLRYVALHIDLNRKHKGSASLHGPVAKKLSWWQFGPGRRGW